MKKNIVLFLLVVSVFLTACSKTILYIEPEVTGKIYSAQDKKPITNTSGYIAFYLNNDKENYIKTDENGGFLLQPFTESYFFIKPNLKELYMGTGQIYIKFDGYKEKIFDYTTFYQEQNPEPNPGAEKKEKINVGIIYLEKE